MSDCGVPVWLVGHRGTFQLSFYTCSFLLLTVGTAEGLWGQQEAMGMARGLWGQQEALHEMVTKAPAAVPVARTPTAAGNVPLPQQLTARSKKCSGSLHHRLPVSLSRRNWKLFYEEQTDKTSLSLRHKELKPLRYLKASQLSDITISIKMQSLLVSIPDF